MQLTKLGRAVVVAAALVFAGSTTAVTASAEPAPVDLYSEITAADIADPTALLGPEEDTGFDAAQTANGAINWFKARNGSTAYQGYCERAVRLAWNRKTHHASAIAHWRSSDGARHHTGTPPRGAFVFWNISQYGHVGLADGNGGVWATSVNGKIGHAKQHYFGNYLGWKRGNSN
ncbi:hypothetical protein [Amycolatopsis sp. 195334CR]|uniref:hypothetical protein n=1 Tax=Amycolatopsis sp. 195334CR TaxID=2814588 RepID=UPI001A8EC61F|nr:hypothetical protein [Amycolatopsis sp. 195334CR]MBN6034878.1 hypothetical protein [Amycolatopsis sp. 195334CR]